MLNVTCGDRAHRSCRTVQSEVRINVVPVQLFTFPPDLFACLWHSKNTVFSRFLLYCPDDCSDFHNEEKWYKFERFRLQLSWLFVTVKSLIDLII